MPQREEMKPDLVLGLRLTAGSLICSISAVLHSVAPVRAWDALSIGARELLT